MILQKIPFELDMHPSVKRYFHRDDGVAYIEFAVSVSLLILILIGVVEVTRYVLVVQKLEKTINTVTDVVTQSGTNSSDTLKDADLKTLFQAAPEMMNGYGFDTTGYLIVSDISRAGGKNTINWQYCGGGAFTQTSRIGKKGDNPSNFPNGFALKNDGEEIVVGEIFYAYSPILKQNIISSTTIYRPVLLVPRVGTLNNPAVSATYSSPCS